MRKRAVRFQGIREGDTMYLVVSQAMTNGTSAFWTGSEWSFEYDNARIYTSEASALEVAKLQCGSVIRD